MREIGHWHKWFAWQPVYVEKWKTRWFTFVDRRLMNYEERFLESDQAKLGGVPDWMRADTRTWWEYRKR